MITFRIIVAVDQTLDLVVLLVVEILAHRAGGRGHEDQRLFAGNDTVGDDIVKLPAVSPLVELVHQSAMNVQSVERAAVRSERLHDAVIAVIVQLGHQRAHALFERRRLLHHALRFGPDDLRLVSLCGHGVDLRACFAVGQKHIQADDGGERRFAVFLADDQDDFAVLPDALDIDKPERDRKDRFLPQLKLDQLSAELAFAVPAERLGELQDMIRPARVVVILPGMIHLLDNMPDRLVDLLRDDFLTGLDLLPILPDRVIGDRVMLHASSRPVTKSSKPSSPISFSAGGGSMPSSCLMIFW